MTATCLKIDQTACLGHTEEKSRVSLDEIKEHIESERRACRNEFDRTVDQLGNAPEATDVAENLARLLQRELVIHRATRDLNTLCRRGECDIAMDLRADMLQIAEIIHRTVEIRSATASCRKYLSV
ncbi:MAG: hypothetical protein U9N14_02020 [Pseudomonadota bacterium]|nr:hypothetical protein [Pseudomonadota bacterium]